MDDYVLFKGTDIITNNVDKPLQLMFRSIPLTLLELRSRSVFLVIILGIDSFALAAHTQWHSISLGGALKFRYTTAIFDSIHAPNNSISNPCLHQAGSPLSIIFDILAKEANEKNGKSASPNESPQDTVASCGLILPHMAGRIVPAMQERFLWSCTL